MRIISIITLYLAVFTGRGFSTTYYIASNGNDSNSGKSLSEAWKTTANIPATNFLAGDSILFEGGKIFEGAIFFNNAIQGTAEQFITFSSFPTSAGNRATIQSGNKEGFYAVNCGGIKITNLIFQGAGVNSNETSGISFYANLPNDIKKEDFIIDNAEVSGYKWSGITFGSSTRRCGFANITISNCDIHDNGDSGILTYGLYNPNLAGYNNKNIVVTYCKVHDNPGLQNIGSNSGSGIVLAFMDGGIIEHCESYNNGWLNNHEGGGPVGIWCWESNNIVMQFNESHNNKSGTNQDGGGFDLDGGTTNSIIQYNYAHDNQGPGILVAQFDGARELKNNIIRYNICENDGGGIMLWSSGSNGGIQNLDIYNNTLYTNSSWGGISIISGFIYSTRFLNNLIQTTGGAYPVNASNTPDIKFYGNCYWASASTFKIKWGAKYFTSLDAWRNSSSQEKLNGINSGMQVDPLLDNPGMGITIGNTDSLSTLTGYKLKSESQLINSGLNLSAGFNIVPGERDFFGTAIPQNEKFDIGACEVNGSINSVEPVKQNEEGGVSVYPNPTHGIFFVAPKKVDNEPVSISIYNLLGQRIKQLDGKEVKNFFSFNLSNYPTGIYFLSLKSNNRVSTQKFFLIK